MVPDILKSLISEARTVENKCLAALEDLFVGLLVGWLVAVRLCENCDETPIVNGQKRVMNTNGKKKSSAKKT